MKNTEKHVSTVTSTTSGVLNQQTNAKGSSWVFVTVIVIALLMVGGFGAFYYLELNKVKKEYQAELERLRIERENSEKEVEEKNDKTTQENENKSEYNRSEENSSSEEQCKVYFTKEERLMMEGWRRATIRELSFMYPTNWVADNFHDEYIEINDGGSPKISIVIGLSQLGILEDEPDREREGTTEVYCLSARQKFYEWNADGDIPAYDNRRMIVTEFFKTNSAGKRIHYMAQLDYIYQGASVSSDIVELYNLILKTIVFEPEAT